MTMVTQGGPGADTASLAGKYMTFRLATEDYGFEILKVRELIGLMEITRVPRSPSYIRGVINLRGKVIPVVDLRVKFEMESVEPTSQTVIIVVQLGPQHGGLTMGVMVDEVLEVRAIESKDVEPPPTFQSQTATDFILGVGKAENRVVFLLDIDRILSVKETTNVSEGLF
ncbi:MAG TPA: chemotaxis protein CheW [Polyangiaceae bacterium]|nr:chemotaxis protein CheW [Polyangiaceae bacterium]